MNIRTLTVAVPLFLALIPAAVTGQTADRPTANDAFPTPVENDLRVVYFGGGLRVPIAGGLTVFGDARTMLALEGNDGILGVWPVRVGVGVGWRF
jgi:hypothetical protein